MFGSLRVKRLSGVKTVRAINGIFGDFKLINFVVFNEFEFLKRIVKNSVSLVTISN